MTTPPPPGLQAQQEAAAALKSDVFRQFITLGTETPGSYTLHQLDVSAAVKAVNVAMKVLPTLMALPLADTPPPYRVEDLAELGRMRAVLAQDPQDTWPDAWGLPPNLFRGATRLLDRPIVRLPEGHAPVAYFGKMLP